MQRSLDGSVLGTNTVIDVGDLEYHPPREPSPIRGFQNPQLLEVRFRATLGQEPEIELMLV